MGKHSIRSCMKVLGAALLAVATTGQETDRLTRNLRGTLQHQQDGERVRVTLWHNDMDRIAIDPVAEVFAARDGTFSFEDVAWFEKQQWGSHKFVVVARGKTRVGLLEVRGDETKIDRLRVFMVDTVDLAGTLVDADTHEPIANGWIWPSIFEGARQVWITVPMLPWRAETDEKGRFVLKGLPKVRPIKMLAGGQDHERTWITVEDLAKPMDIELRRGGRIIGKVLLPDGRPAARVLVMATGRGVGYGDTMSNDAGEFTLSALSEDEYKVFAVVPDLTVIAATHLAVAPGTTADAEVVQLVEGGFIVGRILDQATGKPFVPGPWTDVAMYGPARGNGGSCETAPVRPDGTFRIRAPAGRNRIYLRSAGHGYIEPSEYVQVVEGQETKVEWQLKKAPRRSRRQDKPKKALRRP